MLAERDYVIAPDQSHMANMSRSVLAPHAHPLTHTHVSTRPLPARSKRGCLTSVFALPLLCVS